MAGPQRSPNRTRWPFSPGGSVVLVALLGLMFSLGFWWRGPSEAPLPPHGGHPVHGDEEEEIWTCSMHPQIRQPRPGQCPLCGMDLVPLEPIVARHFETSEAAKELMNVQTAPAERRLASYEVRMVGKIDYDETRLASITAWVSGRIDRLYVDFTGIDVRKGDHMVYLYSPELLVAQDELHRAARTLRNVSANAPEVLKETAGATLAAAREKLRRWGLTEGQIRQAEEKGVSSDHITIYSPIAGTVIHRNGQEGMYVDTGTAIYTIADLSKLWVKLDAYESDLPWLRYGQKVTFTAEAYPGEVFEGQIAFISPMVDSKTRTVKVRVNVDNPNGRLKPEMFVRAVVRADVAKSGKVMDPSLAGKWICPMHPDVVKEGQAPCDICGMDLVKAERLGYETLVPSDDDIPLLIPASAPLITGKRAVVYVEVPDAEKPTYEGRDIALGPRAGEYYIVESGLEEGDRVVTHGNFKIDSALQIAARPSMMSSVQELLPVQEVLPGQQAASGDRMAEAGREMPETGPYSDEAPQEFKSQLRGLVDAAMDLSESLASDDFKAAQSSLAELEQALGRVDMALLEGEAHMAWMGYLSALETPLALMEKAKDIDTLRPPVNELTRHLVSGARAFGVSEGKPIRLAHCPMALDGKGGDWLQTGEEVRNPYYGAAMLACGEITGRLDAPGAEDEGPSSESSEARDSEHIHKDSHGEGP